MRFLTIRKIPVDKLRNRVLRWSTKNIANAVIGLKFWNLSFQRAAGLVKSGRIFRNNISREQLG